MKCLRVTAILGALCVLIFGALSSGGSAEIQGVAEPKERVELPLKAFAQLSQGDQAILSPEGPHIAYALPSNGKPHLVIQRLKIVTDDDFLIIPPKEKGEIKWFRWANNNRLLISYGVFERLQGKEMEFTYLVSVSRDGKKAKLMFDGSDRKDRGLRFGNRRDIIIDMLPDDPENIMMSIDVGFDGDTQVRRVNINKGRSKIIQSQRRGIQNWYTDSAHRLRFGYGYKEENFRAIFRGEGRWESAKNFDWYENYFLQGFADDGSLSYATTYSQDGRLSLVKLDLDTGEAIETLFTHPTYDLNNVIEDPITGRPVGVGYFADYYETKYFDKTMRRFYRSVKKIFKGSSVRLAGRTRDNSMIMVRVSSDRNPGTLFVWDRTKKRISPILDVRPGIDEEQMAYRLPVSYEARDGLEIPGYLTLPVDYKKGDKLPTVLMPHGGPHARTYRHFDYDAQFLANRGYAVFQPNFRGSDGLGYEFEDAGRKQWGGKMQDDLTDAAQWLIEEGIADPEALCIAGGSYGGYAALMGAIKTPDLFKCAASLNGVADLQKLMREDKSSVGGKAWIKSMGLDGESVKSVSPYHRADEVQIPILIVQADDDARVARDQATRMVSRLESRDKDVTYVRIKQGGHSIRTEKARTQWLSSLEAFLDQHIGGGIKAQTADTAASR